MIELYIGPMFSGKTAALIRHYMKTGLDKGFVAFIPEIDHRSGSKIVSRETELPFINAVSVAPNLQTMKSWLHSLSKTPCQLIIIDEFQFFDVEVVEVIDAFREKFTFLIAGLDFDATGSPFKTVKEISEKSDSVTQLKARCQLCAEAATKTKAVRPISTGEVRIGGGDEYFPVCETCWLK